MPPRDSVRLIDTHHHIYPPRYVAENLPRLVADASSFPASAYQNWTPSFALEQMDKADVATAIVSMTSPGIWFEDGEPARARARDCNEFGAGMARDYPGRFGMFAAIPLPDQEGSLREIEYALDTLRLDGIGLMTSYAGKLLGDPAFAAVFDELNRRQAAIFVHPTMSCGNVFPGVSNPTIEFPVDTARTIASLALSGGFARWPNINFIFSHGGGVLPSIYQRIAGAALRGLKPEERAVKLPRGLDYELRRQYYDLASIAVNPAGMAAVFKLFPISQLLYGSDVPFGSTVTIAEALLKLDLAPGDLRAIQRENAARLFRRYAG